MEDELELPPDVETALRPGVIDISQELGCSLPLPLAVGRINRYFKDSHLGYRAVSGDTFRLRVRPRKYPVFGSFIGFVHVYEKLGHQTYSRHVYKIEGLLRYRVSLIWFLGVFSLFFLIVYAIQPLFWSGVAFLAVASAITIGISYELGRSERDEVEEQVEAAFLKLRTTIENLR